MRYIYVLIFVALLSSSFTSRAFGQIFTGGSVGFHFVDGYYIDAAPTIGYRYERLDVGLSPFFSYRKRQGYDAWYSYGNRVFGQFTFIANVFVHAELGLSNVEVSERGPDGQKQRKWIASFPVGGGYRYNLTGQMQAYGMVLYDLMLDDDSPVEQPIIRGGVVYRF